MNRIKSEIFWIGLSLTWFMLGVLAILWINSAAVVASITKVANVVTSHKITIAQGPVKKVYFSGSFMPKGMPTPLKFIASQDPKTKKIDAVMVQSTPEKPMPEIFCKLEKHERFQKDAQPSYMAFECSSAKMGFLKTSAHVFWQRNGEVSLSLGNLLYGSETMPLKMDAPTSEQKRLIGKN